MAGPRSVAAFLPSMKTGAEGISPVPGSEMPMSACFGFARAVDDAAHHGDLQRLDAGVLLLPRRHVRAEVVLDPAGELLEHGRRGAAAAGAGGDDGEEGAEAHGLEELLRHLDLAGAVAAGLGRQRDADGVADALLQEDGERGGGGDDALRPHAGLGEPEVEGMVGAAGKVGIDGDEILHRADLGGEDDAVARQADLLGEGGGEERRTGRSPRASRRGPTWARRRRRCRPSGG